MIEEEKEIRSRRAWGNPGKPRKLLLRQGLMRFSPAGSARLNVENIGFSPVSRDWGIEWWFVGVVNPLALTSGSGSFPQDLGSRFAD
ncbi:MAG: hypothetical protein FJ077_09800 [Cyanobacteria bacterium K_DeepCast_35m_m2_023]|nr:hypothetical protein [Cyanobacteria bacterium K_DeepCast_35m_m2_023]